MSEHRCCHDPLGKLHWKGEPKTCCHVHAEDLPENNHQRGEVEEVPVGWTAQAQAKVDDLNARIAEAEAKIGTDEEGDEPVVLHRHVKGK